MSTEFKYEQTFHLFKHTEFVSNVVQIGTENDPEQNNCEDDMEMVASKIENPEKLKHGDFIEFVPGATYRTNGVFQVLVVDNKKLLVNLSGKPDDYGTILPIGHFNNENEEQTLNFFYDLDDDIIVDKYDRMPKLKYASWHNTHRPIKASVVIEEIEKRLKNVKITISEEDESVYLGNYCIGHCLCSDDFMKNFEIMKKFKDFYVYEYTTFEDRICLYACDSVNMTLIYVIIEFGFPTINSFKLNYVVI